jgi:hypothetical protein
MSVVQIQEMWRRLSANERTAATGAIVVIVASLIDVVVGFGFDVGTITLLGALAVLVIYYLKYAPNQSMTWPMPVATINLGISAIVAILAILGLLAGLGGGLYLLAKIGIVVGAVLMVLGTWREYQLAPKIPTAPPPPPPPAV